MEIRLEGVKKLYGAQAAVKGVSLTICDKALHFILGPSGCGKTTTLRMIAGLEAVSEGKIFFGSRDVTRLPASERNIGMVFQNYALWPHMTVRANIEYGLKLRKLSKSEFKGRFDESVQMTKLDGLLHRYPSQLSGGQQQRVALARSLSTRPDLLLLDEPLSNLDAKLRWEMRQNISEIHRQSGITMIYVTHDQKEALSMGTHITVMLDGHEVQTGTPRELYTYPKNNFLAGFIGETNLVPGEYLGCQGSLHRVKTSLGVFSSTKIAADFNPGKPVSLSIRPETIRVMKQEEGASVPEENSFTACLKKITYLGPSELLSLRAGQGQDLEAQVAKSPYPPTCQEESVRCWVPENQVMILPP